VSTRFGASGSWRGIGDEVVRQAPAPSIFVQPITWRCTFLSSRVLSAVIPFHAEALVFIEAEYQSLALNSSSKVKASGYNNIIQLKAALAQTGKPEIYTDIKGFIKHYILAAEEEVFGYDTVLFAKIAHSIVVADPEAELSLYKYALKNLKAHAYEEQAQECQQVVHRLTREMLKKQKNPGSFIHRFYLLTTQSTLAIALSLLSSVVISTVLLLPAYALPMACLQYETQSYADNYLLDRVLNTLVVMTGLDDGVKIKPLNAVGVLLMLLGKGFFLLIIGNILFKQFKSRFNLE
jgi:hypothetical protein